MSTFNGIVSLSAKLSFARALVVSASTTMRHVDCEKLFLVVGKTSLEPLPLGWQRTGEQTRPGKSCKARKDTEIRLILNLEESRQNGLDHPLPSVEAHSVEQEYPNTTWQCAGLDLTHIDLAS